MTLTLTIRSSSVDPGTIIGVAISSAVLVFVVTAALILYILNRREKKRQGRLIASHLQKSFLLRPRQSRGPRRSLGKSAPLGYTEKNEVFNLLLPKVALQPECAASNSRTPERPSKTAPTRGGQV